MTTRDAVEERLTAALVDNGPDLFAYLRRRTDVDDAADLLAETMVTAWQKTSSLPRDAEQARMWLFTIARNHLSNHQRQGRRRNRLAHELRRLAGAQSVTAHAADDGLEVRDAIGTLPPDQADIVRLVHWEGFSLVQVARMLDIPDSTVRGRYQLARSHLRSVLTPNSSEASTLTT